MFTCFNTSCFCLFSNGPISAQRAASWVILNWLHIVYHDFNWNKASNYNRHSPHVFAGERKKERSQPITCCPAQEGYEWALPRQIKHTLNLITCQRKQNFHESSRDGNTRVWKQSPLDENVCVRGSDPVPQWSTDLPQRHFSNQVWTSVVPTVKCGSKLCDPDSSHYTRH